MPHGWTHDIAVVLAAHGDRAGPTRNTALLRHRDALDHGRAFRHVTAGVLKGEPVLETALAEAAQSGAARILVYPVFMADGYFVRKVLAERVAQYGLKTADLLPPLGIDPGLAALVHADAIAAAEAAGYEASGSRLLLVGHGSELGPASANATRGTAARVRRLGRFQHVDVAFLEEAPFLDAALTASPLPTVVAGFFSGDGLHAGEDVPAHIAQAGVRAVYAGAIGASEQVAALIAAAVMAHIRAV